MTKAAETAESVSVVVEREIPHPPEKVWRALTQQHLIAEWLMANDFEPVVGRSFNLRWEAPNGMSGVIDAEVLTLEPQRTLAYSWSSMGVDSIVTLTLTPTATGTHLKMEQAGFKPDQQPNIQGAKYGWTGFLAKLEDVAGR
jgi:uncharacterized protein YndB with AHSA1/START domain